MTLLIFGLYFASMLLIGEICGRKKVKSLEHYLLSGREHGAIFVGGTLAATVIGAGSTIGAAGVAYYIGISASWYLLSACFGLLLLGFTFAPASRKLNLYTIPEYMEKKYGYSAKIISSILGVVGLLMFLSAQLYAMGALLSKITGVSIKIMTVISALIVILYTWRGGSWAVHISDNIQIALISLGLIIISFLGIKEAGGLSNLLNPPPAKGFENLGGIWFNPLNLEKVDHWDIFALGNVVLGWIVMSTTWHFSMQSTAQRILSSKSFKVARNSCIFATIILIPLSLLVGICGMSSRILYPELETPQGISQVGALPALFEILGPVIGGVFLAALSAVIMSTSDSVLLGASTIIIRDIYPVKEKLKVSKALTFLIGILALLLSLTLPELIRMLEMVASVYCVSLFAPITLGLYWKRANTLGALSGMLSSTLSGLIWRFSGFEAETGIHMLNISLPISFLLFFLFSLLTNRTSTSNPLCPMRINSSN